MAVDHEKKTIFSTSSAGFGVRPFFFLNAKFTDLFRKVSSTIKFNWQISFLIGRIGLTPDDGISCVKFVLTKYFHVFC